MSNLYDLIQPPEVPENWIRPTGEEASEMEDQVFCLNGHSTLSERAFYYSNSEGLYLRCSCQAEYLYKIIEGVTLELTEIDKILGPQCWCCGSLRDLQKDHMTARYASKIFGLPHHPTESQLKIHFRSFARLCRSCNRWKDNGPFCPCFIWGYMDPGFREMNGKMKPPSLAPRVRGYDKIWDLKLAIQTGSTLTW